MRILAGTSGFKYKQWKGSFYPEDLRDDDMLRYYSEHLPTVEINNTFYRMPKRSVVQRWAEEAASDFTFVIKASQRITHSKRLKDVQEPLSYLLRMLEPLGDRCGPLLFQLPPNFRQDLDRLRSFLDGLPSELPAAFEFRHPSWFHEATYDTLRKAGAVLCITETDQHTPDLIPTADWGYLRLRRPYETPDLVAWLDRLRSTSWRRAFVFFKHEDTGAGPDLARRFLDLAT